MDKLPNIWQVKDHRLGDCLYIAWMIEDISDVSVSSFLLDCLALAWFWKPLDLARAMKEVVERIELLTIPD